MKQQNKTMNITVIIKKYSKNKYKILLIKKKKKSSFLSHSIFFFSIGKIFFLDSFIGRIPSFLLFFYFIRFFPDVYLSLRERNWEIFEGLGERGQMTAVLVLFYNDRSSIFLMLLLQIFKNPITSWHLWRLEDFYCCLSSIFLMLLQQINFFFNF